MAASATFALKPGVWFRRGRPLIVSPDSQGTACPLSGRNSTYRPAHISGTGSLLAAALRPSTQHQLRQQRCKLALPGNPDLGEHPLEGGAGGLFGDPKPFGGLAGPQAGSDQCGEPRLAQCQAEHVTYQCGIGRV